MLQYIRDFILTQNTAYLISAFIFFLSSLAYIFLVTPLHEFAHAFAAHKLGDDTARYQGRMSLNPFVHIDWIGAVCILLVGYGFAKPVPVNANNFRYSKVGMKGSMVLTALAGPVSNILAATVLTFLYYLIRTVIPFSMVVGFVLEFLGFLISINITIAVFNLIPIPPLDGSKVFFAFLPSKYYFGYMKYEHIISVLLWVLVLSGFLDVPLSYMSGAVGYVIEFIASLPFKLLNLI